jgi:hypothetical protein
MEMDPGRRLRGRRAASPLLLGTLLGAVVGVLLGLVWTPGAPGPDARASQPPAPTVVTSFAPDSLHLRLELAEEVERGVAVPMTIHVTNSTDRALDLYLTGRPVAFDLVVADEEGIVLWRRLEGEHIAMALRIETLAAGDSLQLADRWDQRTRDGVAVPPGVYKVHGEILTEDEPLVTPSRTLRIRP